MQHAALPLITSVRSGETGDKNIVVFFVFRWNQLDIAIVALSIMGITLEELKLSAALPINPTIIRIMRVLRIARGEMKCRSTHTHTHTDELSRPYEIIAKKHYFIFVNTDINGWKGYESQMLAAFFI